MPDPHYSGRLRFAVLGPLRAWRDTNELDLGPRQQRLALTLLLLRAGTLVQFADLKRVIWDAEPPPTADNMVHRYMGSLRRLLEPGLTARANGHCVVRDTGGYRLVLDDPSSVDLQVFRSRIRTARQLADADRNNEALNLYLAALTLWQGRCATGLGAAAEVHPEFVAVDREGGEATREAARVALLCGREAQVLPLLRDAAARHPLDEALQAELLLALNANGKQAEAIRAFADIRGRLADELGVDPGRELRAAYESILHQSSGGVTCGACPAPVAPAQLPPDLRFFTECGTLLGRAAGLIRSESSTVPILVFEGVPGVGKSTLAVHLAHQVVAKFPDGQLYADLRGFDKRGVACEPAEVLRAFLGALGVSAGAVPDSLNARATLFRSIMAGRRMLILLDNVRDAGQVRDLLPGTPGNAVMITSRRQLTGLAASHGAHLLRLELPTAADARTLLLKHLGSQWEDTDHEALDEIVEMCGRLPLALAVVAARLVAVDGWSLPGLAAELRVSRHRLLTLSDVHPDRDVRTVLSWSYRLVSPGAARMFRLLPLHPCRSSTLESAASLAGVPLPAARAQVVELAQCGLVEWRHATGYRLHELSALYALELSAKHDSSIDRSAARQRLLQHYLRSAQSALNRLGDWREEFSVQPAEGVVIQRLPDAAAALRWSSLERHALRGAVLGAAERGEITAAWQLAWLLKGLFHRQGWGVEAARLSRDVLHAAGRAGDATGVAQSHRILGFVYGLLGDEKSAAHHLDLAVEGLQRRGDAEGAGVAQMRRGYALYLAGDHEGALRALRWAQTVFRQSGSGPLEEIARASVADVQYAAQESKPSTSSTLGQAGPHAWTYGRTESAALGR